MIFQPLWSAMLYVASAPSETTGRLREIVSGAFISNQNPWPIPRVLEDVNSSR
jgi:hypothetical protein